MVDTVRRWLYQFVSYDATRSYQFPKQLYEWSPSQQIRAPVALAAGMHYGIDQRGTAPGFRAPGQERLRFLITKTTEALLDTEIDAMRAALYMGGLGYISTIGADGSIRSALARVTEMPEVDFRFDLRRQAPTILNFTRMSDWLGSTYQSPSFNCFGAGPFTLAVNNPGNTDALIHTITITCQTNSLGFGFRFPTLLRTNSEYMLSLGPTSSHVGDQLFIRTDDMAFYFYNASIPSYSPNYGNLLRAPGQTGFMTIPPGITNFSYYEQNGGVSPYVTVQFNFYPPFL